MNAAPHVRPAVSASRALSLLTAALLFAPLALTVPPVRAQSPAGAAKRPRQARPAPGATPAPAAPPAGLPAPRVAPDPRRPHLLSPNEFLPPSRLRAGMKGYGLTVFRGNKIERFDVTILGVIRKVNNGRDLIVVKLGGPKLQRVTDVIAGMSGSPVYVGGKIVGAVSMGSQFTRESIGYLTPIEDMLEAWDPGLPQSPNEDAPAVRATPHPLPAAVTVNGRRFTRVAVGRQASKAGPGVLALRPLLTPVSVSGVSPRRFAFVARELEKLGLEAVPGGGTGAPGLKGSPLQPGGAVAMSFATGDIDITAVGTLTYRRGDRIVAFGHPFLGIGPVEAGLMTAYIHDIEPSFAASRKIWSPLALVGTMTQDIPYAVGGRIGPTPRWVPLTVRVNDRAKSRARIFNARLTRHPRLTPQLAVLAAGTAIAEVHGQPGDVTATVTTEVTADEVGTLRRVNRFYDPASIEEASLTELRGALSLLGNNPFYPVAVRSVKMDVVIEPGRKTAQIERIFLKQTRYEPGDTVEVGVVLKPYKREPVTRTVRVPIPANAPAGPVMLSVQGGGAGAGGMGISLGGGVVLMGRGLDVGNAATLPQMAAKWAERDRNDALVARLALPTSSLSVKGQTLSDLPPHIEAALRIGGTRSSGVRVERDEVKVSEPTEYVLSGGQALPIRIVAKGTPETSLPTVPGVVPPPPTTPAAPPSTPPGGAPTTGGPNAEADAGTPSLAAAFLRQQPPVRIPAGPPPAAPPNAVPPNAVPTASATPPAPGTAATSVPSGAAAAGSPRLVGRQPGVWRHGGYNDFRAGKLDGVTLTSQGDLRLAPKLTRVAESADPYFWALAPDGSGGVYAGSGDNGTIYRVAPDGKQTVVARTGELAVHALVRAPDGTLYAGTMPHGKVLKIGSDGKPATLLETGSKYVLALALDSKNETLYVASGGPKARIHAVPLGKGETALVYESAESSVTALAVAPDGGLYAGTAPRGLVVHVSGPKAARPTVLYDAVEAGVSGLAVTPDGIVYAATAPRGVLYRIAPGETPRPVYDRAPGGLLSGLLLARDGTLYAPSGSSVVALNPGDRDSVRVYEAPSDIQILSLAEDGAGRVWAATGNVGGVYALGDGQENAVARGEYVSATLDAKAVATWGALRWSADAPTGASLRVQTRSGNTSDPDGSWSDWSPAYGDASGERIASPPARYLQYRATLSGTPSVTPVLRAVEAFYLPPNQAPQLSVTAVRPGEVWRGVRPLRWTATDPDRDTLSFAVAVSPDNGKTWQDAPAASGPAVARPAAPAGTNPAARTNAPAATEPSERRLVAELEAELNRHPEISPEMRARILADAPAQLRQAGTAPVPAAPSSPAVPLREASLDLNTARLPDGDYLVRVTATDAPANPTGARSSERIVGPIRVVNRPPLLTLLEGGPSVQPDRSVRLAGVALHTRAAVRAVQWRVDGGATWAAAVANDGIFDALLESFTLATGALPPGPHTLEVQAIDEAGNVAMQKVPVTVP